MAAGPSELLLFVSGEPETGVDPFRDIQSPWARLFAGSVRLFGHRRPRDVEDLTRSLTSSTGAGRLRLPPDQIQCVNQVVRLAGKAGRTVRIVDVNEPVGQENLVARWTGPNDVFPLLIRPGGAKLVGEEAFLARKVRRFIRGR
ncbi:MAG: hypothetical protein L3K02_08210 [Thermoplasmata archaeon]|nr:hypothetical protein [Thermoplasmata archaeon]